MTTPKQDRNGVPGPASTGGNVAQPGPDATGEIARVMKQAQNAADARKQQTAGFIETSAGAGVDGHRIGAAATSYQWDDGLAVNDVEGGGSG